MNLIHGPLLVTERLAFWEYCTQKQTQHKVSFIYILGFIVPFYIDIGKRIGYFGVVSKHWKHCISKQSAFVPSFVPCQRDTAPLSPTTTTPHTAPVSLTTTANILSKFLVRSRDIRYVVLSRSRALGHDNLQWGERDIKLKIASLAVTCPIN